MILAILLLLTGLTISAVAIYYSVIGLAAIFAAATVPIYIMGGSLEVAKLVCASWLKANWNKAPTFMKTYMTVAVVVLMFITSMGIFGFLSKAHTDQSLISGDVQNKIAIYDEKIRTAKDNIEANRKQLKQMDEAVDQVMARSTDEKGADKANAIRRSQQKDRQALYKDIEANQKLISQLNDEAAPIRAEVRKVEAEVGPIKYIAKLIYGNDADQNLLEKSVTWVIILIVIVFDPLAVIMLLAAQMTFAWLKEEKANELVQTPPTEESSVAKEPEPEPTNKVEIESDLAEEEIKKPEPGQSETLSQENDEDKNLDIVQGPEPVFIEETKPDAWVADVGEKPTPEELAEINKETTEEPLDTWNKMIEEAEQAVAREQIEKEARKYSGVEEIAKGSTFPEPAQFGQTFIRTDFDPERKFIFNGDQWVDFDRSNIDEDRFKQEDTETDPKKKSYMTKDQLGRMQVKTRE